MVEPATLAPTSPPAELNMQDPGQAAPLPTVTVTFACEFVIVPGVFGPSFPRMPCWPTSPPAITPTIEPPLTVPVALTLSIVPPLWPATMPTHCEKMLELKPGLALTLALVRLRLLT